MKHRNPIELASAFLRTLASTYPPLEQAFRTALPLELAEGAVPIRDALSSLSLSEEKSHWFDAQSTAVLRALVPVVRDEELPTWLSECKWAVEGAFDGP